MVKIAKNRTLDAHASAHHFAIVADLIIQVETAKNRTLNAHASAHCSHLIIQCMKHSNVPVLYLTRCTFQPRFPAPLTGPIRLSTQLFYDILTPPSHRGSTSAMAKHCSSVSKYTTRCTFQPQFPQHSFNEMITLNFL